MTLSDLFLSLKNCKMATLFEIVHWVRHVFLWIVSLLFDFATKNLHLATIFYHLVAKWRLKDFVNFEPCFNGILPFLGALTPLLGLIKELKFKEKKDFQ